MHWEMAIGDQSTDLFRFAWDSLLILRPVLAECASEFGRTFRNQLLRAGSNNAALLCSFRLVLDKGSLCYVKAQVLCNLLTFYMYISVLLDCLHGSYLSQMGERKLWNPTSGLCRSSLSLLRTHFFFFFFPHTVKRKYAICKVNTVLQKIFKTWKKINFQRNRLAFDSIFFQYMI